VKDVISPRPVPTLPVPTLPVPTLLLPTLLALALLWTLAARATAAEGPQREDALHQRVAEGEVELMVEIDRGSAPIAAPIRLRLQVDAPAGSTILWPQWGQRIGELSVVTARSVAELPVDAQAGRRRWIADVELESLRSGELQIPPLEVAYRLPGDDTAPPSPGSGVIRSQPWTIQITSVLSESEQLNPLAFRDLKAATALPGPEPARRFPIAAVAGLAGIAALAAATVLLWRRRTQLAPHARAMGEIARIESRYHSAELGLDEAYAELSDVVRRFLQAQWSLPAVFQSSQELSREIGRVSIPAPTADRLGRFLWAADERKFSPPRDAGRQAAAEEPLPFAAVRSILDEANRARPEPLRPEPKAGEGS
jgi:hypothetical protein